MGPYVDALSMLLCSRTFCCRSNEETEIGNHTRVPVLKILVLTFDKSSVTDYYLFSISSDGFMRFSRPIVFNSTRREHRFD
jgi:hypothetical protein